MTRWRLRVLAPGGQIGNRLNRLPKTRRISPQHKIGRLQPGPLFGGQKLDLSFQQAAHTQHVELFHTAHIRELHVRRVRTQKLFNVHAVTTVSSLPM